MPPSESCLKIQVEGRRCCANLQVITDHPPVLCYSAEERIYPFFEFLKSVGISPEKVAKRPTLLGLEVNIDEVAQLLETI